MKTDPKCGDWHCPGRMDPGLIPLPSEGEVSLPGQRNLGRAPYSPGSFSKPSSELGPIFPQQPPHLLEMRARLRVPPCFPGLSSTHLHGLESLRGPGERFPGALSVDGIPRCPLRPRWVILSVCLLSSLFLRVHEPLGHLRAQAGLSAEQGCLTIP